jgi:hypothetical protein
MAKLIKRKKMKRIITKTKESTTTTFPHLSNNKKHWNQAANKLLKARTKYKTVSRFTQTSLRILYCKMNIPKTFSKIPTTNFQIIRILVSSPQPPNISQKTLKLIPRRKDLIVRESNTCRNKKTLKGKKKTTMILNKQKMIN